MLNAEVLALENPIADAADEPSDCRTDGAWVGDAKPVHGREAGGEETGHGQQDDLADRGAERLEVAVADEQHADGEHQGHGDDQAHVPPGLARAISVRCQRAIWSLVLAAAVARRLWRSEPPNRLAKMSGAMASSTAASPELAGEGVESGVEWNATLDADDQGGHIVADGRRRGVHRRLDGGEETPMGGDAVPKGLDPGGQGLQATGDPAGGVGLEGRPQGPAHRPADGRAHRPAGDQPDDEGEGHRAQRPLGGWPGPGASSSTLASPGHRWTRGPRRSARCPPRCRRQRGRRPGSSAEPVERALRSRRRKAVPAAPAACPGAARPVRHRRARRRSRSR